MAAARRRSRRLGGAFRITALTTTAFTAEAPQASPPRLIDRFGRVHTNLRVSVTDRCNLRCFYCMPADNVTFMPRAELLSFEEIERVVRVAVSLGVNKVRLTGANRWFAAICRSWSSGWRRSGV